MIVLRISFRCAFIASRIVCNAVFPVPASPLVPFAPPMARAPLGATVRVPSLVVLLGVMVASSIACIASRTFALGFEVRLGRFGVGGWSATSTTMWSCADAATSQSVGSAT
ncbi:hypothetical protein N658DRAFT_502388 [Parathielavia hyrcaniae]|uniref:Uncharacterized protein n=1 Tax=Parathielavia hyrcaniae TaxID=113614 RepID=A0AAN6PU95_9PEZI|nr:hypothetical protein N658DRAFT_502388 [Parathielavia hyrcaniae]